MLSTSPACQPASPLHRKHFHFPGLLFGSAPITLVCSRKILKICRTFLLKTQIADCELLYFSDCFQEKVVLYLAAIWQSSSTHMFCSDKAWQIKFSKTLIYTLSFPIFIWEVNHGLIFKPGIWQTGNARGTCSKRCNREKVFLYCWWKHPESS